MGSTEHLGLPKYIAVKVSPIRWQVAELTAEQSSSGWQLPVYAAITDKLSQSDCNNRLTELQRLYRESHK